MDSSVLEVVQRFNDAFNRHDVDAVMALMSDTCVFENPRPAPDGERVEGHDRIRAFWERFFARSPQAHFNTEEIFAAGDRCVVRWAYSWVKEGKRAIAAEVERQRVRPGVRHFLPGRHGGVNDVPIRREVSQEMRGALLRMRH